MNVMCSLCGGTGRKRNSYCGICGRQGYEPDIGGHCSCFGPCSPCYGTGWVDSGVRPPQEPDNPSEAGAFLVIGAILIGLIYYGYYKANGETAPDPPPVAETSKPPVKVKSKPPVKPPGVKTKPENSNIAPEGGLTTDDEVGAQPVKAVVEEPNNVFMRTADDIAAAHIQGKCTRCDEYLYYARKSFTNGPLGSYELFRLTPGSWKVLDKNIEDGIASIDLELRDVTIFRWEILRSGYRTISGDRVYDDHFVRFDESKADNTIAISLELRIASTGWAVFRTDLTRTEPYLSCNEIETLLARADATAKAEPLNETSDPTGKFAPVRFKIRPN